MILGCAWYPEHWDESRWDEDVRLMQEAGVTMVRLAEFAWSRMEPEKGQFSFDWLERAIALAAARGITTVLGTPTAAPPAWLTQKYPDTLAVHADGQTARHGMRCHYSPNSPRYRVFCRRIAEEMAKRFGQHQSVIGWQIDNEYNSESWDDETRRQFQGWLQDRYQTLDALNAHWSTAYWSQEYTDWAQIPLPLPWGGHNPGLSLAWRRFMTATYRDFQRNQLEVIRQHADPRQWITHNFMGWFDRFDYYALSEDLDIASWDNYVGTGHLDYLSNGAAHDLTRGLKRKNFLLLETQPGSVNWGGVNNMLDKGEVRCMAWHAVGHGADAISYWQWRSAPGGQEQYHGSLIAQDGHPRPLYEEVAKLGKELGQVDKLLQNTTPVAQVGILHSYDDRWAIDLQRHHKDFDPVKHLLSYYRPLRATGLDIDIIHPMAPLNEYKLVVAPHLHLQDEALVDHLLEYVWGGGHLVLGPRTGMKDMENALLPMRQPGKLAEPLGAHVEEFFALDKPFPVTGVWGDGEVHTWAEWVQQDEEDGQVLLRYMESNGWLDDKTAVFTRKIGSGRITYVGAWLSEEMMNHLTPWMLKMSKLEPVFPKVPEGVEICQRTAPAREVFICINYTKRPLQLALPYPLYNLVTRQLHESTIWLPAMDVTLLGRRTQ